MDAVVAEAIDAKLDGSDPITVAVKMVRVELLRVRASSSASWRALSVPQQSRLREARPLGAGRGIGERPLGAWGARPHGEPAGLATVGSSTWLAPFLSDRDRIRRPTAVTVSPHPDPLRRLTTSHMPYRRAVTDARRYPVARPCGTDQPKCRPQASRRALSCRVASRSGDSSHRPPYTSSVIEGLACPTILCTS